MEVMRKASVDYGTKRSGIAITDPTATIVSFSKTVSPEIIVEELKNVKEVEEIIVGLPLNLKGIFTLSTRKAVDKAIEIANALDVPVYLVDERFTSTIANRQIASNDSPREIVDELSASILLEDYLKGTIKRYRVFTQIPSLPKATLDLIQSTDFKRLVLISGALRGIERFISRTCEIYEDNPVYFRLREINISEKETKISLHFGVFWDIILSTLEAGDLVVCDSHHMKDCTKHRMKNGVRFMVEKKDGSIKKLEEDP